MNKYQNNLYTHNIHLSKLITQNGIKDIYDAVSNCTRCGYCIEVCPTYIVEKKETLSPRGRNQIIRALIEGKYRDVNTASYTIDSCLLCSACTNICYGKVQTSDIVLEARREEYNFGKSIIYKMIINLRNNKKFFDIILKIMSIIHNMKISKIIDKLGIFLFLGYPSLSKAIQKTLKMPKRFLHEEIDTMLLKNNEPKWIYFLTCGTDYLFPQVGKSTINVLNKLYGNGIFMKNECCGLISYNYGCLEDAKKLALKNIEIYEMIKQENNNKNLYIIGDCSSCIAFMKSYPQLFIDDEINYKKAVEFSNSVKDITEFIKPQDIKSYNEDFIKKNKITIHHSCKAYNDQNIKTQQEDVLKPIFKENLVELQESNICCGGAGAYAFIKPEFSEKILFRKISNIAKTQSNITLASSTSCLLQLKYGAKNNYSHTQIMHYIELIDRIINK